MRTRRLPRLSIGGSLALTLLLVLGLAMEGWRATRAQRAMARAAVDEEMTLVASRMSSTLVAALYERLSGQFAQARQRLESPATPGEMARALADAGAAIDACACMAGDPALAYVAARGGEAPAIVARAGAPTADVVRALLDSAAARPIDSLSPFEPLVARVAAGGPTWVLVYRHTVRDGRPVIVGLASDAPTFFAAGGARVMEKLRAGVAARTTIGELEPLAGMRVVGDDGAVLWASDAAAAGSVVGAAVASPFFGTVRVEATLEPRLAARVVEQRLPAERGPLLLAAALAATALLGVALLQHRRERELARLRTDFTASVSHELRTPLAQILLFGQTLTMNRTRSESERRDAAEVIVQEAQRLMHMVENVLHFARSEREVLRIAPQPMAIAPATREVVDAFRPLLGEARVQCRFEASDAVEVLVDRGAWRQVLLNLLDNAAKYGPPGQCITVCVVNAGDEVRVTVDDEGPGVPHQERERVWRPFVRGAEPMRAGVAGSGIGLAVVRELVALHGGRVVVGDAPNVGARFRVILPVHAHAVSAIEPSTATAPVRAPRLTLEEKAG